MPNLFNQTVLRHMVSLLVVAILVAGVCNVDTWANNNVTSFEVAMDTDSLNGAAEEESSANQSTDLVDQYRLSWRSFLLVNHTESPTPNGLLRESHSVRAPPISVSFS